LASSSLSGGAAHPSVGSTRRRYQTNNHPRPKRRSHAPEHPQGMSLIVGVLKTGDDGLGRPYLARQLRLGHALSRAQRVHLSGDLGVDAFLFDEFRCAWMT